MIRYLPFLFGWIALLSASPAWADQPIRIRVLSYNIHHAAGVDGKLDLERIARVVLSANPDIVALQEVDQGASRSRSVDQPAELSRLTNMQVCFGANIDLQGGRYGNAVLSRFPILHHQNHLLPNMAGGEQRGFIEAEVKLSSSEAPLLVLATHFDHRGDPRERVASATAINQLIKKKTGQPALLVGDLNDVSDSETLMRLTSTWTITNATPLPTIPVGKPSRQIDFILFRPADRWRVLKTRVLSQAVASDHRAIVADLELLPDTNQ